MSCRDKLEAYLRQGGVPYEIHHHQPAFTAQQVARVEHLPGRTVAKVVILIADRPVMLVLPAPARVDLFRAAAHMHTHGLRLAREDELKELFGDCDVGAMPPFGNLYGIPVWVDHALAANDTIVFPAGTHDETISLAFRDFERLVQPTVVALAVQPERRPEFATVQ